MGRVFLLDCSLVEGRPVALASEIVSYSFDCIASSNLFLIDMNETELRYFL